MSIFGKKGGGLAGSLLGFAVAAFFPPAAGLTLGYLATALSIGFSVGSLLFPPEPPDVEEILPKAPTVREGGPLPLIVGKHVVRGGTILYFNPEKLKKLKKGDFDKLLWAPMQLAICMCEISPINELYPSLAANQLDKASANGKPLNITMLDASGDPAEIFMYFVEQVGSGLAEKLSATSSLLEIQEIIEAHVSADPLGAYGDSSNPDITIDVFTKSFPQISWGGAATDFFNVFEDPDWAPVVHSNGAGVSAPPEDFSGFWDEDLPAMKGVLTLASPVWPLGKNSSTVPNNSFLVEGCYTSIPGDFYYEVLTNTFFGFGASASDVNALTFSGPLSAIAFFNATESVSFNSNQSSALTAAAWVDKMNFHLDTILRKDHKGRLELLPERSLFAGPSYTQADYEAWVDSGALESGDAGWVQANQQYFPGYPVIFDVYDGDHSNLTVSDQQWGKTFNKFFGSYADANANYKTSYIPLKNETSFREIGFWSDKNYRFDMYTDPESVISTMLRKAKKASRPNSIARFTVSKKYHTVRPGDGVRIWSKELNLLGVYFRVRKVDDSRLGVDELAIEASLDLESLYSEDLLTVDNQAPAYGAEPSTPDDPNDPFSLSLHPDFWQSNLAYADPLSAGPNSFITHLYAAKAQDNQIAFRQFAVEGVLNPYVSVPIPQTALGTVIETTFGYRFALVTPIKADWYEYSLGDTPILVELLGGRNTSLEAESWFGTKSDMSFETDYVCLILSGRSADLPNETTSDNHTEVLRFKSIALVSGNTYKLSNMSRGANKENPIDWAVGTSSWIADLSEPIKDSSLPYSLWGNRSLAQTKELADAAFGSHRVRAFVQSIAQQPAINEEEASGISQGAEEGLSETYDVLNSQFFQNDAYIKPELPPMSPACAIRIGDVVDDNALWFKIPTPSSNILPSAYSVSSWAKTGSVSTTSGQGGLGYAPGNLSLESVRDTDNLNSSVLTYTEPAASLSPSSTYCLVLQVRNVDADRSVFLLRSLITDIGAVKIDWAADSFSDQSSGSGTGHAYKISDDVWRVFLTCPIAASPSDLLAQITVDDTATNTTEILVGELVLLNQATEPMYTELDWIIQFQPTGSYGGIGDKSLVPGVNTLWGDFPSDTDEDAVSSVLDAAGTYKVDARITTASSSGVLKGQDSVTILPGDKWPSFVIKNADLALVGLSEVPSLATEWHPKQLSFHVSKLGSDSSTYNIESEAEKKGPWTRTMRLF